MNGAVGKEADGDLQLEVDELMLDYVLYTAVEALLKDRIANSQKQDLAQIPFSMAETPLSLVNSYLPLYKTQHPRHRAPLNIRIRLQTLKFAVLFLRRYSSAIVHSPEHSLELLRQRNDDRVAKFLSDSAESFPELEEACGSMSHVGPLSSEERARNLARTLAALNIPLSSITLEDQVNSASLLDSLPGFMYLSATIASAEERSIPEYWMDLASEYMLQAALEQYLVYGAGGDEIRRPAFAWGLVSYEPGQSTEEEASLNAIFEWNDDEGHELWERRFSSRMMALLPEQGSSDSAASHLHNLADKLPIRDFETKILSFILTAVNFPETPVLVQLERGQLEGLTVEETDELKRRCGI